MAIQHTRTYEFIFTLASQKNIRATIPQDNLNKQRSIRTFAPVMEDQLNPISDQNWYGKGHTHPTFRDVIQRMYTLPAQDRSATSLEALHAVAMVMGEAEHEEVAAAGGIGKYSKWVVTWRDIQKYKEVRYTTFFEKMGTEYHRLVSGAWVGEFTMTGNRDDHVVMNFTGGAARYFPIRTNADDSSVTENTYPPLESPGISKASFYKTLFGRVRFDTRENQGVDSKLTTITPGDNRTDPITGVQSPAHDISAYVLNWNVTISQGVQPYFLMGNEAGQEDRVSLALIGDQTASGSVQIFIDKSMRDRFLSQETMSLELICAGPDLVASGTGAPRHQMSILIPNMKVSGESFGEDGDQVGYTLTFDEGSVLKDNPDSNADDDHVRVTFITDIDDQELFRVPPEVIPAGNVTLGTAAASLTIAFTNRDADTGYSARFRKATVKTGLDDAEFGDWSTPSKDTGSDTTISLSGLASGDFIEVEYRAVNGKIVGPSSAVEPAAALT